MIIFMLFILCTQLRDKRHQPTSIFQSFVVRLQFDHSQNENASRASFGSGGSLHGRRHKKDFAHG